MSISLRDKVTINGIERTFKEWCLEYNITPQVAQRRVNMQGRDPVEAIMAPGSRKNANKQNSRKSYWRTDRL